MTIQEYIQNNSSVKPKSDIVERWESRIVANGLHTRGRAGAESYIGQYCRGVKGPKVIGFARIAEIKGFQEMANRFWEEAYFLDHGVQASVGSSAHSVQQVSLPVIDVKAGFGRKPQLPVFGEEDLIQQLLHDDDWGLEEKKDGRNLMADVANGEVAVGNKKGLANLPSLSIRDALSPLGNAQIDGEDVKTTPYVFDILSLNGRDLRQMFYVNRHEILVDAIENINTSARFIELVIGTKAKLAKVEELRARKAEGFILKRLRATYIEGNKHGNQYKHQFRATNSFVVGERNGDKNSVGIYVFDKHGNKRDMGNLTVPNNKTFPLPGSVVEVKYLYCNKGPEGKLHQPVFEYPRSDAAPEDCLFEKLKIQPEDSDD